MTPTQYPQAPGLYLRARGRGPERELIPLNGGQVIAVTDAGAVLQLTNTLGPVIPATLTVLQTVRAEPAQLRILTPYALNITPTSVNGITVSTTNHAYREGQTR